MKKKTVARLPWWRVFLILLLTLFLCAILATLFLAPIKQIVARRYESRGDTYFEQQQFDQAVDQYQKALSYDPLLNEVQPKEQMAAEAPYNIAAAQSFFAAHHVTSVLNLLSEAEQNFTDPKAALTEGVKLYTAKEFVYAQYPLQKAVTLDPNYPEAWNYLALTYRELAKINPDYTAKAKSAAATRDSISSKYISVPTNSQ